MGQYWESSAVRNVVTFLSCRCSIICPPGNTCFAFSVDGQYTLDTVLPTVASAHVNQFNVLVGVQSVIDLNFVVPPAPALAPAPAPAPAVPATADPNLNAVIQYMQSNFTSINHRFDVMERRFDVMERRFDVMERRFDTMESQISAVFELAARPELARFLQKKYGHDSIVSACWLFVRVKEFLSFS